MADELLGEDFKLYYDSAGDWDTPDWEEQTSVGDLSFDPQNEQVEIPKRKAFKFYKKGRGDWSLGFTMNYDKDNQFHVAIAGAIESGDPVHLAFADGDIDDPGTVYYHAWFLVGGPHDASLDTNANIEVEAKIHTYEGEYGDEQPKREVVSS